MQPILQTISIFFVCVCAFEDVMYVYGQDQEMVEHGRIQYQLLKERGNLPHYGPCWKAAVEHLDEACRHLSEETQSDVALRITNCFLKMSGHETYRCEADKKPNLRAICINSMSDRAFNVYTEFYTHTQNICWFLRGQIWHETIAENTLKVGKQLEVTAQNQEGLLQAQKESLELQEKMLKHGKFLEKVLEDLYISSTAHKDVLMLLSQSIHNLQIWIVGEISWIDSVIFYVTAVIIIFLLTSSQRTVAARLPVSFLLLLNLIIERLICYSLISSQKAEVHVIYANVYDFIWYTRYGFLFISLCVLIYKAAKHRDLTTLNNELLYKIKDQNDSMLNVLKNMTHHNLNKSDINIINESLSKTGDSLKNGNKNNFKEAYEIFDYNHGSFPNGTQSIHFDDLSNINIMNNVKNMSASKNKLLPLHNFRYNLRSSSSRQGTPEC